MSARRRDFSPVRPLTRPSLNTAFHHLEQYFSTDRSIARLIWRGPDPCPTSWKIEEQGRIADAFGLDVMIGAGQIKDAPHNRRTGLPKVAWAALDRPVDA
jgi:hypothetical protein